MEEFAAKLCNVFGYINATKDDVIVLESDGWDLLPNYILIDLHLVIIEFRKNEDTWTMKEL